ncbi:hypothetical protein O1611_g1664 [Lasiodiplodia mahajangana]|uniref:Uncharacterized protein n=1 Tax=Lasiodiplodia mahajangana TaxID=1108764 RepID=A0ACC2JWR3_9PEZI|nr:hypothetical protein O1611_g1664 [Lasiodiplodia mahajangana]
MTNLGPLTTTFTPVGPDCTSTFLGYNQNNAWAQYGAGGSSSVACLPSGFIPSYSAFYSPGICPSGYTKACYSQPFASGLVSRLETRITCCPTSFQCNYRATNDPFACASYFKKSQTFEVSVFTFLTNSAGSTTALVGGTTTDVWSDNYILAYGPIVHIAPGDIISTATTTASSSSFSSSSYSTTPTTAPSDSTRNQSSGLSQGAVVGIAVGAVLAGVFIIGTMALFLRRRRRLGKARLAAAVQQIGDEAKSHQGNISFHNGQEHQNYPYELHAKSEQTPLYELNATGM